MAGVSTCSNRTGRESKHFIDSDVARIYPYSITSLAQHATTRWLNDGINMHQLLDVSGWSLAPFGAVGGQEQRQFSLNGVHGFWILKDLAQHSVRGHWQRGVFQWDQVITVRIRDGLMIVNHMGIIIIRTGIKSYDHQVILMVIIPL